MSLTALERRQIRVLRSGRIVAAAPRTEPNDDVAAHTRHTKTEVVQVVGAHSWAGGSAVALALAEAATRWDDGVVLVDGAARECSGLVAVTDRELGDGMDGWSVGRRGAVEVRRAASAQATPPDFIPGPADAGVLVVDRGRSTGDQSAPWAGGEVQSPLVLVCRATIPGVRAAEGALSRLGRSDVLLAAVGARRLPGVVSAAAGPRVTQIHSEGRIVCFPYVRRLDIEGLDDRPLSKALLASAARAWGFLSVEVSPVGARVGVR